MSKTTVSRLVKELIEEKYLIEVGEGQSKKSGGRKPVLTALNNSGRYVIGVDLGVTNTIIAVANINGEILKKIRKPTIRNHNIGGVVSYISNLVEQITEQAGIEKSLIKGIGVAIGGVIERETGIVRFSSNFSWKNVYLKKLLEEKTGLYTLIDNCTRVMALGLVWHQKGISEKNFFFINAGFGIGSSLVIDGSIYDIHSEFGHIPITYENVLCQCGKKGCLEAIASGNAIERKANQLYNTKNSWLTAKNVAERAKNNEQLAKIVYNEAGGYLGKGISIVANIFNPKKIIIGGGVSQAGDILLKPVMESFSKYTMDIIKEDIEINISPLGMDGGIYGAITMILNERIFNISIFNKDIPAF
ncbi:MAG: ROK family protein [Halanaerobiales bacterium]|nr:ROK family protein [Halanaerobiales bacterium]